MKIYLQIIKDTWEEYMVYRLNFFLWRIRMVMQILVTYFLWWAIFSNRQVFAGYTESMMLTYILLSSVVRTIVLSTTTMEIGDIIHEGNLSNHLVRPFSFFSYYIARDTGDKLLNLLCSVVEVAVLLLILRPPIFIQGSPLVIVSAFAAAGLGMVLYFLYNMIFGFMGFWTQDVWAPRFLSFVIMEFLAGSIFPLDILPKTLFFISKSLPFYYFLYFPLGIYLGKITGWDLVYGFAGACVWIGIFALAVRFLWSRGLHVYTAEGR
jgi:ABC-2 type transport system permease protein